MAQQGQVVGYARVSSEQQNLARQLESIGTVDRLFQDKVSGGSRADRAGLTECLRYIRDGDTVRVASMDRLARSLVDLQQIVGELLKEGASVQFIKESQLYSPDSSDSMSRLLLQILGAFAEFERNLIRERQAEGIAIAKRTGKYRGHTRRVTASDMESIRKRLALGVPKAQIARELGVNRSTLYRTLAIEGGRSSALSKDAETRAS